jgi:hypothetical protein
MEDPWYYTRVILDLVQWFSVPWFALTVFRLKPRNYCIQCLYLALICNYAPEALLNLVGYPDLFILTQVVFEIMCFWLIFRFSLFYSLLVSLIGSMFLVVLQMSILHILSAATHMNIQAIIDNSFTYHVVIILLILSTFLIAKLLNYYRVGFSFVNKRKRVDLSETANKKLLVVLFTILLLAGLMPITPTPDLVPVMTLLTLGHAICVGILLMLSYKKEMEED